MKHFALAGNPNCGKTTLFNSLTGSTAHVGNWPGVTVDKREGVYKKCEEPISIVDLPGIYSLSPYTPEEVISRNYIIDEKPDCIINIVDATNLERNLYLTTQLMEMDVPMVIALNMMDIIKKNGETILVEELEKRIGLPVIEISALREENLDVLMKRAYESCQKKKEGTTVLEKTKIYPLIEKIQKKMKEEHVDHPLFHAIKLVELDELETSSHKELIPIVEEYKKSFHDDVFASDFEALIADARYTQIASLYAVKTKNLSIKEQESKHGKGKKKEQEPLTKSDRVDKVLTNRWAGIPIFLAILFVIFHLTFANNLFFLGGLLSGGDSFEGTLFQGLLWTVDGINSPGVMLQTLVINLTDAFTEQVGVWLEAAKAEAWVSGLICDGILAGLFSVISFLPQILLLFLFFSILEDSGYMARVAFILDRIFRKFGLSGRAFLPMIMGFGCSVPAMINTRTLADDNERTATIRVIPFFSCGAKLPILTAVAGALASLMGFHADLVTYGMYLLGMIVALLSVVLMRNTTMKGEVPPFIMELPAYHLPQFKGLMIHLWDKLKHFIKKAFTIILASTILIWCISHFAWNWTYLPDEEMNNSILAGIGQLVQPLFTPLGFGSQLTSLGWVFAVASVTGLIAKEDVIGTFKVLAVCIVAGFVPDESKEGVDAIIALQGVTGISASALISFIAFNMLTIPCFAAVATAKAELPKKKFWPTIIFWIVTSYFVSSMIYVIGEWTWTIAIYLVVILAVVLGIYFWNNKSKKEIPA